MPQVFQVLKCYKCSLFQVHQTKKSNKFECKVCGEKQSIKRHYGIGTAKDCRMHVQKLNVLRANIEIKPDTESNSDPDDEDMKISQNSSEHLKNFVDINVKISKWSAFIDKEKVVEMSEEQMLLEGKEVFLEVPLKKKPKIKLKSKTNLSKDYLYSVNNTASISLKPGLKLHNKHINNFETKENLTVQDETQKNIDISTSHKKQLKCNVDNIFTGEILEKPVVLPKVNKNSKWALYVDTDDNKALYSDVVLDNNLEECVPNSNNIFSLCDDSDLDQVLDI